MYMASATTHANNLKPFSKLISSGITKANVVDAWVLMCTVTANNCTNTADKCNVTLLHKISWKTCELCNAFCYGRLCGYTNIKLTL